MPPKKQQKKQIIRIFQPQKFWKYTAYPAQLLQKTNTFIQTFQKQLTQLINQQKTLQQNYQILCDKIGIAVHPCLQNIQKEQSKFPELTIKQYGPRKIQILNYRVDAVTLRLFGFLIGVYKVNCVKFGRNQFNGAEVQVLKKIFQKQGSVSTLFFEWNPLTEYPARNQFFLSTVRPCLQHLILRENNLGNQICLQLLTKIKQTPDIKLQSLDLTGNQLTPEITPLLCKYIEEEKNIQFLGLSKNKLCGNDFLSRLFGSIGEVPLTEQDQVKYQESCKARDQVIQRNKKKKKGAPDQPIPFVFQVKENQKGKFFVKNTSIQNLNLAKNGITDASMGLIKQFAENQGAKIQVFLDSNKLSKKSKDILQIYKNLLL